MAISESECWYLASLQLDFLNMVTNEKPTASSSNHCCWTAILPPSEKHILLTILSAILFYEAYAFQTTREFYHYNRIEDLESPEAKTNPIHKIDSKKY